MALELAAKVVMQPVFPEGEFTRLRNEAPNLLIVPHVGGASSAMWPRAHKLVREQLHRLAAGEPLANVVSGDY